MLKSAISAAFESRCRISHSRKPGTELQSKDREIDRVGFIWFNVPVDTLQVTSEIIFPTNHLTGTSKQNQTTTKL